MEKLREPERRLVRDWLDWLDRHCTVRHHAAHLRWQCRESREQALRGCVTLDQPPE